MFTEGVSKGFLQDVEIWKHKTRIDNPLLVEEDGAVYQMRRWYQQFYVDVADVTPDMTDRFEIEVDTTAANEKWHVEVEENLKTAGRREIEKDSRRRFRDDRTRAEQPQTSTGWPGRCCGCTARTTITTITTTARYGDRARIWSKAPDFASDPERAAAVREATQRDRERYLTSGLVSVDCRFCHVTVAGQEARPGHTAVQWNSEASQRCAYFAEIRQSGGDSSPRQVLPEARRQHQTRCRRRVSGRGVDGALPRRRLAH